MAWEIIQDEQAPESVLGTLGRGALRTGARVAESVAGLPGDIASGVLGLGNLATRLVSGSEIPGVSTVQQYLPTSEKIREHVTRPLTGEYLEPRGSLESGIDTIVGDVASLLTPGGIASKGASLTAKTLGKTALKAAGANIVGSGVGEFFGAEAGALAKGLTLGLSNLAGGRKALTKQYKNDYELANFAVPESAQVTGIPLRTRLGHDIKTVKAGVSPNKNTMLSVLEGVQSNIDKKGNIKVKDLLNLKRNLNEWIGNENIDKSLRGQFGKTAADIRKEISNYAKTNPNFAEPYYRAEEIYAGLQPSSQISKFAEKNLTLQKALQNWTPLSFAGYFLTKGLKIPVGIALKGAGIGGAVTLGAREAIRFAELVTKSPTARKYYLDAAKSAALGDAAATAKNLKAFDQAASKYEEKNIESFQPQSSGWQMID